MAIKVYTSAQAGAPTLNGQVGALLTVLDACLVNGYNSTVTVSGITSTGGVATVTTATAHGFVSGDSAVIAGADQTAYNGEFVVSVVDSTHFTYPVTGSPVSPATTSTSFAMKRASANFTKVYVGTNKAVYRTNATTGSRPYLRVVDDGTTTGAAREAQARGYLSMTDVDTGSEPFPTAAQNAAGTYIYKSSTVDTVARPWVLITDGNTFYFQACMDQSPNPLLASGGYLWWFGFGDILSTRSGDPYTAFIAGSNSPNAQTSSTGGSNSNGMTSTAIRNTTSVTAGAWMVRSFSAVTGAVTMQVQGHGWDQNALGTLAIVPYPHPPDNGFIITQVNAVQGGVFRGRFPGVYEPIQGRCLSQFDTVSNVDGYSGRTFQFFWGQNAGSTSTTGSIVFDITGDGTGVWS